MYEIEIKSLLGSKERADELKRRLAQLFPTLKTLPPRKQRNHYFNSPRDLQVLERVVAPLYPSKEQRGELSRILKQAKGEVSIRTREADLPAPSQEARQAGGQVFFVLKASIGDDTSANGVSRIEFEEPVALSLAALDQKLLNAGLTYQAKWSREREEYDIGGIHLTVDKNAGYGYLAEFEKMLEGEHETEEARRELRALMADLDCAELPQERLERMFAHYNKHWQEYYGTDKMFVVE